MSGKRTMMAAALAIGLVSLTTGPALAGKGPKLAKDDPSRRVCRNLTPVGTRLTTRVCRTKAEWDSAESKAQDGLLQHQMNNSTQTEAAPRPN